MVVRFLLGALQYFSTHEARGSSLVMVGLSAPAGGSDTRTSSIGALSPHDMLLPNNNVVERFSQSRVASMLASEIYVACCAAPHSLCVLRLDWIGLDWIAGKERLSTSTGATSQQG